MRGGDRNTQVLQQSKTGVTMIQKYLITSNSAQSTKGESTGVLLQSNILF